MRAKIINRLTVFALVRLVYIFCVFQLPSVAFPDEQLQAFKIKGRILYEVFLANGTNSHWTRDFNVTVQDCGWIIESVDTVSGQYAFSTRTNGLIYYVTGVNLNRKPILNNYAVVVENNDVPPSSDVSGISAIWLAYASSCYFKSVEGNQYKPVWMLDDPTLRAEGFTMHGILNTLEGNLPKQLVYLDEGIRYARVSGHRIILHAPASFRGAVTNAAYRALETTNIGTFQIPKSFEFQRFGVRRDYSTYLLAKITGAITSLEPVVRLEEQIPNLKGGIFFIDKRFEKSETNVGVFTYSTTNQMFLSSTNPIILRQKKLASLNQAAMVHQSPKQDYLPSTKRRVVVLIMAIISILPAVWFLGKYVLRIGKKQKTNERIDP